MSHANVRQERSMLRIKLISSVLLLLSSTVAMIHSSVAIADPYFPTTSAATTSATKLGYSKTNYLSSGQAVYTVTKTSKVKGLTYISPDVDSHNGGAWKAAGSVENLAKKETRLGTYNEELTVRVGD
jgi:Novel toxin 21